jgi:hypothetical protein
MAKRKKPKVRIPENEPSPEPAAEFGGDTHLIEKLHRQLRDSFIATEERRDNFIDNMKLCANDQWTEESKSARSRPGEERPMPVHNKVTKNVMTLAGIQAQTGTEPHLLPFEPDDVIPTEVMALIVRSIRERNSSRLSDQGVFINKLANLWWWKIWVDFSRRIQGDFRISKLNPLSVFEDPNWLQGTWDDARFCHQQIWYPVDEACELWPEHAGRIKGLAGRWAEGGTSYTIGLTPEKTGDVFSSERLFWDRDTRRVSVFECWWKETVTAEVAIFLDTEEIEENPARVKELKEIARGMPKAEAESKWLFLRRPVTRIKTVDLLGDVLLNDVIDTPYDANEFPFFPSLGYHFWRTPIGPVDLMRDAQRGKNKIRASMLEMLGRNTLSGWWVPRSSKVDRQELLRFAQGHGVEVEFDGEKPPTRIEPPTLDQTTVLLEQQYDREIDSLPNVNNELQGQTTQTTVSGRAIEARQRGGLLTHEHLFFSFREEVARYTKFLIKLIQQYMTPAEALRILGSFAIREPDNEHLAEIGGLDEMGMLEALDRSFSIDYDVVIGSKSYDPTRKQAEAALLTELRQAGVLIPDDVLFEVLGDNGSLSKITAEKLVKRIHEVSQQAAGAAGQPPPGEAPAANPPQIEAAPAA